LQDYFGELGQDWEEQVRQIAKEREFIASIGTVTPQTDVAAPVEVVKEAPAIDEPTPVNPEKDPNAGPDAELSAKVELDLPTQNAGETDDKFMARCMGNPTMVSEFPENDQRSAVCVRQMKLSAKSQAESFTMKDDPDYKLSDKELDMVANAIGLKKKEKIELAKPTAGMIAEAKKGLEWRREYKRGGTEVGVARARDIINSVDFPDETIARISSYLARHEVDKKGEGFNPGEPGFPSAGRIAWALWGGDPAQSWAAVQMRRIAREMAARPGPKSASQTPAPASERKKGSETNPAGTASTRSKAGDIEISEAVEQTLKNKIADFKKSYPNRKAPSLGALKKVFRRGAGAFSTSFRPTIGGGRPNSRTAWAIARVNKFLKMAGGGEVKKSYREADGDLL
jgi:hypothetical protein